MRWVTRTYWSRTPRSAQWWAEFARERHGRDVTHDHQPGLARAEDPTPAPESERDGDSDGTAETDPTPPEPSAAYRALTQLRSADPRMSLSEAECRALEPLAAEWLARGATPAGMARALTDGLPPNVTNPGGLARNRLESKMPPKKNDAAETRPLRARVTRVLMACATCDADERTAKIINGICEECRAEPDLSEEEIKKGFEEIAYLGTTTARFLKQKLERRTGGPVPDTFRPVPIEDRVHYHYRDNRDRIANGLPPRRWKP
ncbi:hypothetical protein [Streptomyces sp. NPDC101776]|uniref:hypothetical protein n=1 Tax=Streptomyces sp. NPDC101776 TaxID=3366146 RepID=UPI00381D50F2